MTDSQRPRTDFATKEMPIGPWHRSGSSWRDGEPPHRRMGEERAELSIVWADSDHVAAVAVNDVDGCWAVIEAEASLAAPAGLRERLDRLADTVDSYCDHEDEDPGCMDSLHALSEIIRHEALEAVPRSPEPPTDRRRAPESGYAYDEWLAARRAASPETPEAGIDAAWVLREVKAICDEWGGNDSWGIHDIYVDTLMERLAARLASREEGERP